MSKRNSALGKGLGALLPAENTDEIAVPDISKTKLYNFEDRIRAVGRNTEIKIDLIDPNPYQPRTSFDAERLEELAASIRQVGIVQPITVRAVGGDRYQLISGERRLRAAGLAGLTAIPSFVREADSEAMLEMALVENLQRQALNPIEIGLGYQRLIDECGLKQDQVADKVGKNRTTVANFLRLLKLPPNVQAALKDGTVAVGHARALLALENERDQTKILGKIIRAGLSVRAVEELVRKTVKGERKAERTESSSLKLVASEDPSLRALRDLLRNTLSTQVYIKPTKSRDGGRIEVEYYSDDDLERIIEIMVG